MEVLLQSHPGEYSDYAEGWVRTFDVGYRGVTRQLGVYEVLLARRPDLLESVRRVAHSNRHAQMVLCLCGLEHDAAQQLRDLKFENNSGMDSRRYTVFKNAYLYQNRGLVVAVLRSPFVRVATVEKVRSVFLSNQDIRSECDEALQRLETVGELLCDPCDVDEKGLQEVKRWLYATMTLSLGSVIERVMGILTDRLGRTPTQSKRGSSPISSLDDPYFTMDMPAAKERQTHVDARQRERRHASQKSVQSVLSTAELKTLLDDYPEYVTMMAEKILGNDLEAYRIAFALEDQWTGTYPDLLRTAKNLT